MASNCWVSSIVRGSGTIMVEAASSRGHGHPSRGASNGEGSSRLAISGGATSVGVISGGEGGGEGGGG